MKKLLPVLISLSGFDRTISTAIGHDLKRYFEPDSLRAEFPDSVAEEDPHGLDFSDLMEERFARFLREAYEREIISMSRAGEMLNLSIMEMRALVRTWKEL
nr:hypothetical protein [uncultured Sphaerochaeta sp.]